MSDTELLLLNLELEAAAARNADLSRQLERMSEELACSSIRRFDKIEHISRGTQTELDLSFNAVLDLDDLLFEIAEAMFRCYPATPIDLSSRRKRNSNGGGSGSCRVEELAQRCLCEMRLLKTAWETKVDGYNKFIDDLQKMLGEYCRSLETLDCQLQEEKAKCSKLSSENALLSQRCADADEHIRGFRKAAKSAESTIACLTQRTSELEAEKDRLIDRGKVLAKTVVSLKAECALGPWGNPMASNKGFAALASNEGSDFVSPTPGVVHESNDCFRDLFSTSVVDLMRACQGSAVNPAFPHLCVSPENVVDFCSKMRSLK